MKPPGYAAGRALVNCFDLQIIWRAPQVKMTLMQPLAEFLLDFKQLARSLHGGLHRVRAGAAGPAALLAVAASVRISF
jgi:hypothetical protein